MFYVILTVCLLIWLCTRLHYVPVGRFSIKQRSFFFFYSKYIIVHEGRFFLIPFLEKIMRDKKSGMILQFPLTPVHHEISSKFYINEENIQFLLSLSFNYNIIHPDAFKLVTNFDYEDFIFQIESKIIQLTKKIVKKISIHNGDLTQLKKNSEFNMKESISDIENQLKISFSDFKINHLNLLINETNVKKIITTYGKIYNDNKV